LLETHVPGSRVEGNRTLTLRNTYVTMDETRQRRYTTVKGLSHLTDLARRGETGAKMSNGEKIGGAPSR